MVLNISLKFRMNTVHVCYVTLRVGLEDDPGLILVTILVKC